MILQAFVLGIFGVCIWLEYRKWKIGKMVKTMVSPKQYPIVGVGHQFFGLDNESMYLTKDIIPIPCWPIM